MIEMIETKLVYQSPSIKLLNFETEGVLCISNNIPDWEENDDVL